MGRKYEDKNNGLSEAQRLQLKQFEKLREKNLEESKKRLQENIEPFKLEYADLVELHGIKHIVKLAFKPGTPNWLMDMVNAVCGPILTLSECREQLA